MAPKTVNSGLPLNVTFLVYTMERCPFFGYHPRCFASEKGRTEFLRANGGRSVDNIRNARHGYSFKCLRKTTERAGKVNVNE